MSRFIPCGGKLIDYFARLVFCLSLAWHILQIARVTRMERLIANSPAPVLMTTRLVEMSVQMDSVAKVLMSHQCQCLVSWILTVKKETTKRKLVWCIFCEGIALQTF
jgi:hypothetical protein